MPIERFIGRVALLTGATQGIGLATARRLGQEGCKVVISSRKQQNVDEALKLLTGEGIEASGLAGNQSSKEDRKQLIDHACDRYGGIDSLFINAAVNPHQGNLLTVTESQFDKAFSANVKSNFQFIQEVVPVMEARGGGSIVTNSTASSYGVINIPASHGLNEDDFAVYWRIAGTKKGDLATRIASPDELATVVAFLLSDDASYIAGNVIVASGGYILTRPQ